MKSIRKLYLQNAAGQRRGLNGEDGVYASELSGFGFSLKTGFADLGRGFFSVAQDESEPQSKLAFTMTFTRSAYATYESLLNWLAGAKTITIIYAPGIKEYCRDVTIDYIQKSELNRVGWLEAPCSFVSVTPWYLPQPTSLSLESADTDAIRRYPYTYSSDLRYGTDSASDMSATIAGAGHLPGSLDLSYYGAITNPRIRLTGNVSGITFGVCSVKAVLGDTDTLRISTRYDNSYVKKVAADGQETDLLDVLDLSSNPFFHIPVDEPCTLAIESDAEFAGVADMLIYYYFRSV